MSHRIRLQNINSKFGRIIPKPVKEKDEENIVDTPLPIQDQIEALRVKIAIKERYNKVKQDEFKDSKAGTSENLAELLSATKILRTELIDALESEKTAVQHSLRLYRTYQLALTDKAAKQAIPWLKDKLFDIHKNYSLQLFRLFEKRKKLEEAESTIGYIEKWPVPGSLGWEKEMFRNIHLLENKIENTKAKVATVETLHSTYLKIKFILQEEYGKYYPILKLFENQCQTQLSEFKGLQKMMHQAIECRENADLDLAVTEQESSVNRKFRRKQMYRIRKTVEQVLSKIESNTHKEEIRENPNMHFMKMVKSEYHRDEADLHRDRVQLIKQITAKIEALHESLRKVLSVMRITDVRQISVRTTTVEALAVMLTKELKDKVYLQESLLFQKSHLYLIHSNIRYTGQQQEQLLNKRKSAIENAIEKTRNNNKIIRSKLADNAIILTTIRFAGMSIISTLDHGHHLQSRSNSTFNLMVSKYHKLTEFPNIKVQLKLLYAELSGMYRRVLKLRRLLGPEDEDYSQHYSPPTIPDHLVRVGSPRSEGEESDEDDFIDSKVPGRNDIKREGIRLKRQAIIAKGLR